MEVNYWLYSDEFKKHSDAISKGEPIEVEVMDQQEKIWKQARVIIFSEEVEGGQPSGLLGPYGEPFAEGQYYIKILEEISLPLEDEE